MLNKFSFSRLDLIQDDTQTNVDIKLSPIIIMTGRCKFRSDNISRGFSKSTSAVATAADVRSTDKDRQLAAAKRSYDVMCDVMPTSECWRCSKNRASFLLSTREQGQKFPGIVTY